MGGNTYKSDRKPGLFTYLESVFHFSVPVHYLPRLLFLLGIGLCYVGNTHCHERMLRQLQQLEREVDALKVDYTTLKAGYMFDSKQSEVARRVAPIGLALPPHPPLKVKRIHGR